MSLLDLYELDGAADRILVTSALPYVNNVPHLGNLVPILSADCYSRYLKLKGIRASYICATDEHGTRTEIEAARAGLDEDTYCRRIHERMLAIFQWFHVDFTFFGRTSSPSNHRITQEIFLKADANGWIEERTVEQLYDPEAQQFLPDTYVEGTCPICHTPGAKGDQCDTCGSLLDPLELIAPRSVLTGAPPQVRSSRHLFMRLDALEPRLQSWLESKTDWDGIIRNMPLGWIAEGLKPRSITRDLKWGVPVPKEGYEDKVFYVWFDAPIGYIGATADHLEQAGESLDDWWKGGRARLIHFLGKDNVPFHTLLWPGTLIAADDGWNLPDFIAANEYLTYEGGQFSKSRKRGVFSEDVLELGIPADVFRFFLLANRPEKRDTNFSFEALQASLNADLVGNVGNLVNRLLGFIAKRFGEIPAPGPLRDVDRSTLDAAEAKVAAIDRSYASFELRAAVRQLLELSDLANGYLQSQEPWRTFKTEPATCRTTLWVASSLVYHLARWLWPVMPERCEKVLSMLGTSLDARFEPGLRLSEPALLFERLEDDRVTELTEAFRGAGQQDVPPLDFEKQPGVTWPCVILELRDLNVRRRINALERWKDEQLSGFDAETILAGPRLAAYDTLLASRDLGHGRPVSVRNLADLVRREGKLPNINALVDIYNTFSLKEALVMGAYERRTIRGKLVYAVADGTEHFVPVKGEAREPIQPGEWVLRDEHGLVVTKIATKQSEAAAVTPATTHCAMCIQGLEGDDPARLTEVAVEMAERIVAFCGGEYRIVHVG
jgi:methionyl-tRNA synthetase